MTKSFFELGRTVQKTPAFDESKRTFVEFFSLNLFRMNSSKTLQ
jgi:hypothetical protein